MKLLSLLLVEFTVRHVAESRELKKYLTTKVQALFDKHCPFIR